MKNISQEKLFIRKLLIYTHRIDSIICLLIAIVMTGAEIYFCKPIPLLIGVSINLFISYVFITASKRNVKKLYKKYCLDLKA